MKLIIGLGNPDKKYASTWHNLGFLAVDLLAKETGGKFKTEKKLNAMVASAVVNGEKIVIIKPLTFMNRSGSAALSASQYYKISPSDIIVIHDDIDLPLGTIRLAQNSSAGGHNGIKSIIENLKTKNFVRIKIGARSPKTEIVGATDYVLEKIGRSDKATAQKQIKKTAEAVLMIINDGLAAGMNTFNRKA